MSFDLTHVHLGRRTEICPRPMDYPRAFDSPTKIAGSGYEIDVHIKCSFGSLHIVMLNEINNFIYIII